MKKTNTTSKKAKQSYSYIVDITKCENEHDMVVAFAEAKQKAGLPITDEQLEALIDEYSTVLVIMKNTECQCNCKRKKENIFKRIWNFLKYSFNW